MSPPCMLHPGTNGEKYLCFRAGLHLQIIHTHVKPGSLYQVLCNGQSKSQGQAQRLWWGEVYIHCEHTTMKPFQDRKKEEVQTGSTICYVKYAW